MSGLLAFTLFHVLLSLAGIVSGLVVVRGPFAVAQGIVLLLFAFVGFRAARRFQTEAAPAAAH
ncbi:MAG TPA: hypothetical protein VFQ07_02120 [Candidatus Polarisedimenticolia bacterium]|nr:hypothetical protein [Candidatus Polarisedimenticolia bacterium]